MAKIPRLSVTRLQHHMIEAPVIKDTDSRVFPYSPEPALPFPGNVAQKWHLASLSVPLSIIRGQWQFFFHSIFEKINELHVEILNIC